MVEAVTESLEQRYFVPSLDLVEETVDPSDCLAFMISSQDCDPIWKSDFQKNK